MTGEHTQDFSFGPGNVNLEAIIGMATANHLATSDLNVGTRSTHAEVVTAPRSTPSTGVSEAPSLHA